MKIFFRNYPLRKTKLKTTIHIIKKLSINTGHAIITEGYVRLRRITEENGGSFNLSLPSPTLYLSGSVV